MTDFPKGRVVQMLINSGAIAVWELLYDQLIKNQPGKKIQLRRGFVNDIENEYNILKDIIDLWVGRTGSGATVAVLIQAFVDIGEKNCAEALGAEFGCTVPAPSVATPTNTTSTASSSSSNVVQTPQQGLSASVRPLLPTPTASVNPIPRTEATEDDLDSEMDLC